MAYNWAQPAGIPKVVLIGVSTIHAATAATPPVYQQYQYWPYAAEANKPLLQTIITNSPNGGSGVTTAFNNYDAQARVASTTDGNGNVHQYTYLLGKTFVAVKNSGGVVAQVWTRYFDAQGRDTGHEDASLNRWTIYYDDGNNPLKPTRITDPMGRTATTTYDIYGHITSTTSPRGVTQISTWSYSPWKLGRLIKTQTRGSDGTLRAPTAYNYNEPSGLLSSATYPHPFEGGGTISSSLTCDGYGNPLSITEPGENVATRTTTLGYTQDGAYARPMFVGRPLTVTDALGHTTHLRYDARGNLTSMTDAAGIATDTEYDLADQTTRVLLPASGQTGAGRGQLLNTYAYLGGPMRTSNTLDESGLAVRTYNYTYGNEGELKAQSGSTLSQSVEYDALYRMIRFQDGGNNPTIYGYDGNGRLTTTAYPNANATNGFDIERTTAFDTSGLPLQSVDGRGIVSNLSYEADGSPAGVTYPASAGENVALTRDAFGQVTQRSDASGTEEYIYNYVGNLYRQITRYKAPNGALLGPFTQTVQQYRTGALYRNSTSLGNVSYGYDNAGRLTSMADPDNATTIWNYADNDWLQGQTLPTGTTTALNRNVLGQVTSQRHANSTNVTLSNWGSPTNAAQKQLYNAVGQLTRSTATATPSFNWGGTTNYAYDNRSQLTQEASTRGAGYSDNFGYSGAGNISSWKGISRAYNADNQEVARSQPVAFLYDGAGNTTQLKNYNLAAPGVAAPTQKLIYNAQGQLAELRDASNVVIATYVYRGDGKRAWKQLANGTRSYFYYMGEQLIGITNGIDVSALQLWGADGLVGARNYNTTTSASSKFYNLYDPQGNLAQTINATGGAVVSQSAMSAWGEPIRNSAGAVAGAGYGAKFGYVRDAESGFYLCTLRYYDPSAGRWLTRDPIGYAGGSNLYVYVENDPVNAVDPSGLITSRTPRNTIEGNNQALWSNIAGAWESAGIGANAGIDGILRVFGAPYYAIKPDAPGLMESMGGYDSKDPIAKWSRNSGEVAGYAISIWMATPQSAGSGGAVSQWGPGTSKWVMRGPASWRNWVMSGCPGRYALKSGRTWIPKPGTVSRVPGRLEGWKTILGQSIIK